MPLPSPQAHAEASPKTRYIQTSLALSLATETLDVLANSLDIAFLRPISLTTKSLIKSIENVKSNRKECIDILDEVYHILSSLIVAVQFHWDSDSSAELSPKFLRDISSFTETLNQIHTFVSAQADGGRIKKFFKQTEMSALNKACRAGLYSAVESFEQTQRCDLVLDIERLKAEARERHERVLALIDSASDDAGSGRRTSIDPSLYSGSSNSLTLLPSRPTIFHGRDSELDELVHLFLTHTAPRIALLGPGGIGKTSVAKALIHHPHIVDQFGHNCFFVSCESAGNTEELAELIAPHVSVAASPGKDLPQRLVKHFQGSACTLLVLDNFESAWEPLDTRAEVDDLLSLLSSITMRGAERPSKVQWSRPFLPPLQPLPAGAARQTFIDIADSIHPSDDVDALLRLADNLPLAVTLLAHLADAEGSCAAILERWAAEKTSILSQARTSANANLDRSISLSLASPRLHTVPHAIDLLSLLALLPDGLSDIELLQSGLPVSASLLACKSALLRTSLAYTTPGGQRLKVLVPIREYLRRFRPCPKDLREALLQHYHDLLSANSEQWGIASKNQLNTRLAGNLANIHVLIETTLSDELAVAEDNTRIVNLIFDVNSFRNFRAGGRSPLFARIPELLGMTAGDRDSTDVNHTLGMKYLSTLLNMAGGLPPDLEKVVAEAEQHLPFVDTAEQCSFYNRLGECYRKKLNIPAALEAINKGLALVPSADLVDSSAPYQRSLTDLLIVQAQIQWTSGAYPLALENALEAHKLSKLAGRLFQSSRALWVVAACTKELGHYARAAEIFSEAIDDLKRCDQAGGRQYYMHLASLGQLHGFKSEYVEARAIYAEVHHAFDGIDGNPPKDGYMWGVTLQCLADLDLSLGVPKEIISTMIDTAEKTLQGINARIELQFCHLYRGDLEIREGNRQLGMRLLEQGFKASPDSAIEFCSYTLGSLAVADENGIWSTVFLAHSVKHKQKFATYKAMRLFARDLLARSKIEVDTARSLLVVSLDGFTRLDVHEQRAECMVLLGEIKLRTLDPEAAMDLFNNAKSLIERTGRQHRAMEIDVKLQELGVIVQSANLDQYRRVRESQPVVKVLMT
ncbi:hypothetical protein C8F01DRAFT_1351708 [Mycena amicta]|nr:hypothetical protein C8F01DRAFT_1351708 [Mycena amicta]